MASVLSRAFLGFQSIKGSICRTQKLQLYLFTSVFSFLLWNKNMHVCNALEYEYERQEFCSRVDPFPFGLHTYGSCHEVRRTLPGMQAMFPMSYFAGETFATQSIVTNEPVVSVEWLHDKLNYPDVKILDASWYMPNEQRNPFQEFQIAHIPGALFFDVDGISDRASNLPHMLPSEEGFGSVMSALGISNKDNVVVYDGKGIFSSARVWWMFRVFGHAKVWVLDGGLPRWRSSGFEVESSASGDAVLKAGAASEAIEKIYKGLTVPLTTFQAKLQPHLIWNLDQVRQNIANKTHQHIDARSKDRFDGIAPEPRKGIRSGHVPMSKCIPFSKMLDGSQNLLHASELQKLLEDEGISLDQPIVTSCGTGVTACILALGLHRLGKIDVPIYDGSWTEWGGHSDTPVATS